MDREIGQVQLRKPVAKDSSPKLFTFDGVFYTEDTTEQIYEVCINCSMFANVSTFMITVARSPTMYVL